MNEAKKGYYDKAEADKYIAAFKAEYEAALASQKERIFSQVEDIDRLKSELLNYKKREDYISRAILSALQKADQIEAAARQKYEVELNKLTAFYNKFVDYYNNIIAFYPPDGELVKIGEFLGQMDNIIEEKNRALEEQPPAGNFSGLDISEAQTLAAYEQERRRLSKNGWQIKSLEEQINNINVVNKNEELFKKYTEGADEAVANLLAGIGKSTPVGKIKKYLDGRIPKEPPAAAIDLEEVLRPTQSLEDLCAELGLLADSNK